MPRKSHSNLYSHKVLAAVIDFLCMADERPADIREIVDRRLAHFAARVNSGVRPTGQGRSDDTVSAAVLHRWHRDRALIDNNAAPRPLRAYGPSPSVESIVRSEKPTRAAKEIVADMVSLGLLKSVGKGKYLPKARVATIGTMHPVLIEHVSKSLVRLLKTVQANTSGRQGAQPLIERFTHIPDLPIEKVNEFREFAQEHGSAFLASVDDWLEARRVRNAVRKSRETAAGVHVFAYVDVPRRKNPTPRAKRA